jgi:phage-related protein
VWLGGRPLVWLCGEIKTPPLARSARIEAGFLLRRIQEAITSACPHSRPMPSIGSRCHELRFNDRDQAWRLVCRIDPDAIVILEVFSKKSRGRRTK